MGLCIMQRPWRCPTQKDPLRGAASIINDLCDAVAVVRWQREADGFRLSPEISGAGTRRLGARSSRHE